MRLGADSPTAVAVLEITDTVGSVLQEGKVIDYSIHHSLFVECFPTSAVNDYVQAPSNHEIMNYLAAIDESMRMLEASQFRLTLGIPNHGMLVTFL